MGGQEWMTRAEVTKLLLLVASYGGRTLGQVDAARWQHDLRGVTAGECETAILAHAATDPTGITPAAILARIRAARRATEARTPRAVADPAAERARFAAAGERGMAVLREQMGWSLAPDHRAALRRPCPVPGCHASVGVGCRRTGAGRSGRAEARDLRSRVHPSRLNPVMTDTTPVPASVVPSGVSS
jgi:hypothetical protein